jgi:hypothetical protein
MGKNLPNIDLGNTLKKRDRLGFKSFVLEVITETFLYEFTPDKLELLAGVFFQLTLENKKLLVDQLQVDNVTDYVDVYLYGVRQPQSRYNVSIIGNDIIITFTENITRLPEDVIKEDFKIKGKIGEIE